MWKLCPTNHCRESNFPYFLFLRITISLIFDVIKAKADSLLSTSGKLSQPAGHVSSTSDIAVSEVNKNIALKILRRFFRLLRSVFVEVLIITGFVLLVYQYLGKAKETIKADGVGYYDYLPALFIHHDLYRKGIPDINDPPVYHRLKDMGQYVRLGNYKVNKYPCGTALLQLPFFTATLLTTKLNGHDQDGYQSPFQKTIFHAAITYLFLCLFFLKKTLRLFDIKTYVIIIMQILLVFATPVVHYANADAGYSHIYSLFAITAFMYFVTSYFRKKKTRDFLVACALFGLILILRQINIIIILLVPFLAGSFNDLKYGVVHILKKPALLAIGLLVTVAVFSVQSFLWYAQTGHLLVYSYQGEKFNFMAPQFFKILFSFQKGLFVYTPILFLSIPGSIWLIIKRSYYLAIAWLAFFLILTYVLSSWYCWYYGASFGLRAFVDYFSVFIILMALMLNSIKPVWKTIILTVSALTIPLNIIQAYQYKESIMHWALMDGLKYRKIFLLTQPRYQGMIWKDEIDTNYFHTIKEITIDSVAAPPNTDKTICSINTADIPGFERVSIIRISIDNDFDKHNDARILVKIHQPGSDSNYYWHNPYLIKFSDKCLDEWQTGVYNYQFPVISDSKEKLIEIQLISVNIPNKLKNVKIKFLDLK